MQCREFENRLNEVLDERGRPELDMLLASHAHHCESCGQMLARYELVCEAATSLPLPKLPADFSQRVVSEYLRQAHSAVDSSAIELAASRRRLQWSVSLVALAAVLLIAILPLLARRQGGPLASGNGALAMASRGGKAPRDVAKTVPVSVAADSAATGHGQQSTDPSAVPSDAASFSGQYADLAKTTGRGLSAAVLSLPGVGGSLAGSDSAFEQPVWMTPVADGLRPVTDSMSDALHVLMRVIPSSGGAKQDRAS